MFRNRTAWNALAILVGIALSGCAPAYHAYPDTCIPYAYCPEPPLPYTRYDNCHCPTPVASQYFEQHGEIPLEPASAPAPAAAEEGPAGQR